MVLNILNPLEQFKIISLFILYENTFSFDMLYTALSFTNSHLFLLLNITIFLFLCNLLILNDKCEVIPNRFQYGLESIYHFILNMVLESIGHSGKKYFSWIFFIFIILVLINLSGMVPYSFTVTSHLIVTFWLGLSIFIGITIIGFATHGIKYFNLFIVCFILWLLECCIYTKCILSWLWI